MSDVLCPLCLSAYVSTAWENQQFDFREGETTVLLAARLPIRQCQDCSFEFLDAAAEDARETAIENHLASRSTQRMNVIRLNESHLKRGYAIPPLISDVRSDVCSMQDMQRADRIEISVGYFVHVIKDRNAATLLQGGLGTRRPTDHRAAR